MICPTVCAGIKAIIQRVFDLSVMYFQCTGYLAKSLKSRPLKISLPLGLGQPQRTLEGSNYAELTLKEWRAIFHLLEG